MFDVVATLCLLSAPATCAERTVPVGAPACQAALSAAAPRLSAWAKKHSVSDPTCAPPSEPAIELTEIAPGVHVHTGHVAEPSARNEGDVSNFAIVVGGERVAVIDSGARRGRADRGGSALAAGPSRR